MQRFAEEASGHVSIRALFLSVTLGAAGANRWQTVEQARRCFGAERVRWHLLNEEKLLRVNGVRELANPVALRIAAPRIASCRLYTPDNHRRARLQDAYAKLADAHEAQGNPDVAFGIIDVNLHGGGRA